MRLFDTVILVEKNKVKLDEDCILGLLHVWKMLDLRLGPRKYKSPSGYCRKNTLGSLHPSEKEVQARQNLRMLLRHHHPVHIWGLASECWVWECLRECRSPPLGVTVSYLQLEKYTVGLS